MTQIESLIQLSDICEQEFSYDCTLAPLRAENVDFAYWEDRHGDKNDYWTGNVELYKFHVHQSQAQIEIHLMFTWPPDYHLTFPFPNLDLEILNFT